MNLLPFKALFPNPAMITSPDSFFGRVKEEYPHFYKSGFFRKVKDDAIYVYSIIKAGVTTTGIIAVNDFMDFEQGNVFKHEDTLDAKEQNTLELLLWRKAQIKPVLLAYENEKELDDWLAKFIANTTPQISFYFNEAAEHHEIRAISNPGDIETIQNIFKNRIKYGFIADGHHRCATLTRLRHTGALENINIPGILAVYIPFSDLQIFDYNRVVEMPFGLNAPKLVAELAKYFYIESLESPRKPKSKHELVCIIRKDWFSLKWKPGKIDEFLQMYGNDFDANMLNEYVMKNIFNIVDVKSDTAITYFEGNAPMQKVEKNLVLNTNLVAFLLYPISKSELVDTASAGKNLPPKSTWFEPRIKNGLLVLELAG